MFSTVNGSIKSVLYWMILLSAVAAPSAESGVIRRNHSSGQFNAGQNVSPNRQQTLIESLRAEGHFTKLLALLDKAGLTGTLSDSSKSFTLFAPDDDAFALLPAVRLADLMADSAKAREAILPYILNGRFTSKDLIPPVPRNKLLTLAGSSLQTSRQVPVRKGATAMLILLFDTAQLNKEDQGWPCCGKIVSADHLASNGIYHAITFVTASGGVWR
jgi:uncharacterized surface protein with fasciclin (FAS1) repeats